MPLLTQLVRGRARMRGSLRNKSKVHAGYRPTVLRLDTKGTNHKRKN